MLKTLRLFLDLNKIKPVFRIPVSDIKISCLLDSGAEIPIWCGNRTKFHELFSEAAILDKKALLTGFGGSKDISAIKIEDVIHDVYRIPVFKIKNEENDEISIKNLIMIMAPDRQFGCDYIIGSSLLYGVINYKVVTINDNVLELEHNNATYVMYLKDSSEYVRSTYTKELKSKDENKNM